MTVHGKHIYNFKESLQRLYELYFAWQTTDISDERHWLLAQACDSGELIDLCGDLLQGFNELQCDEEMKFMPVADAIECLMYPGDSNND